MLRSANINSTTSQAVRLSPGWIQVCLCVFVVSMAPNAHSAAKDEDGQRSENANELQHRASQRDDPHDTSNAVPQLPPQPVAEPAQVNDELQLPRIINVPLRQTPLPDRTRLQTEGDLVTLVVRDGSLGAVLNLLAEKMDLNVVAAGNISGQISLTLNHVPLNDALDAMLSVNGYRWVIQNNIIMVSSLSGGVDLSPRVQGREVCVFNLDYVSATDIDQTVQGLLSPVGKSFVTEVSSEDKLRTREELVVQDIPEYLDRVRSYIAQADQPPQQVLIEAHILQVELKDNVRHGVDLQAMARMANSDVTFSSNGIANPSASPAFLLNIAGDNVDSIIEMIQSTTDAKTLASPKVLAVNGQEARIQIGEQLGYLTTTTTQTSTLQDVQFIDLGVVLTVTPVISRNGQILMTVKPEVSSGRINPSTGLPDAETTEVTTTVLLPNGHAMVIGGLIKEENTDQQSKLPIAGDIPVFGKLFQRRNRVKDRSEIIIVLTPRIVPYGEAAQWQNQAEVQRATSPLLYGPLIPVDRRNQEPVLPNANAYADVPGKPMECFPTPPVAYSPYSHGPSDLPFLPMAPQALPLTPSTGHQFLPPATESREQNIRPIEQTSASSGFLKRTSNRVRRAVSERPSGWHTSRESRR